MRPGGGSPKGGQFEREVCVKLSLWITKGKKRDCLWRSAMSGGRATIHTDIRQCGDICAVAPEGNEFSSRFFVECKHRKSLDIHGLVTGTGRLLKFWKHTRQEAQRYNRHPMMIAKQNFIPTLLCFDDLDANIRMMMPEALLYVPGHALTIFEFDAYMKHVPFKEHMKQWR